MGQSKEIGTDTLVQKSLNHEVTEDTEEMKTVHAFSVFSVTPWFDSCGIRGNGLLV